MPIPIDLLTSRAHTMGDKQRGQHVTREDALNDIIGYAKAWGIANNDRTDPSNTDLNLALRAYRLGLGKRFSARAGTQQTLPMNVRTPSAA